MNRKNASTFIFSIIFCLLAACIIIYPQEAFSAALDGLKLWFNVVCPALLPFFICVEILIGLGIVSLFGSTFRPLMQPVFNVPGEGSFSFFMSIFSGYPVGAKIVARLRQENLCTLTEGQRLLTLCSTSGPLFIIGAVAGGIMNNPALGFLLAVSHYLSAISVGFFMRYYKKELTSGKRSSLPNPIADMLNYRKRDGRPIGMLMGDAIKGGVNLILMIGGFIIFFSVITRMMKISGFLGWFSAILSRLISINSVTPDIISGLLIGFLEVTNGIRECSILQIPLMYKTALVSFMIGFGGLSVNAQVMSIISETDLKFGIYIIFKLLQGIFAAVYSYILLAFAYNSQVFKTNYYTNAAIADTASNISRLHIFISSGINLILVLTFMLLVFFAKQKRLNNLSLF